MFFVQFGTDIQETSSYNFPFALRSLEVRRATAPASFLAGLLTASSQTLRKVKLDTIDLITLALTAIQPDILRNLDTTTITSLPPAIQTFNVLEKLAVDIETSTPAQQLFKYVQSLPSDLRLDSLVVRFHATSALVLEAPLLKNLFEMSPLAKLRKLVLEDVMVVPQPTLQELITLRDIGSKRGVLVTW